MGFGPSQGAASSGFSNPMTTSGDTIYGGTGGTATRLAKSTDGYVYTLASGVPSWAAASGGSSPQAFAQTADVTVSSTTSETTLVGSGSGSKTIASNALTAGKRVVVKAAGVMSIAIGGSNTFALKVGSVTVASIQISNPGASPLSSKPWMLEAQLTVRSTGAPGVAFAWAEMYVPASNTAWNATNTTAGTSPSATSAVDTTASNAVDFTVTCSSSSNACTMSQFTLDVF